MGTTHIGETWRKLKQAHLLQMMMMIKVILQARRTPKQPIQTRMQELVAHLVVRRLKEQVRHKITKVR